MWDCYKSDYVASPSGNENLARYTSMISNKSTDVWSLRKVVSGLGANINIDYEGNTYNQCVLGKNRSLIINSVGRNGVQDYTFNVNTEGLDLTKVFHVGDAVDMVYAFQDPFPKDPDTNTGAALLAEHPDPSNSNDILVRTTGTSSTALQSTLFPTGVYTGTPIVKSVTAGSIECTVDPSIENDLYAVAYTYDQKAYPGYNPGVLPLTFRTGNIALNSSTLLYGGGLRVKDIIVDDLNGHVNKTSYNYGMPGAPNGPGSQPTSSGVTSYEPTTFDADVLDGNGIYTTSVKQAYRASLYSFHSQLLQIAREMPAPGIMYEYVTVADSTVLPTTRIPINGSTVYQYEVFKPEMIGVQQYNYSITGVNGNIISSVTYDPHGQAANNVYTYDYISTRRRSNLSIKDYTSRIGNLKRVITYDDKGDKLTEKITHYLHDNLENTGFANQVSNYEPLLAAYNNMGVLKERYGCIRLAPPSNGIVGDYDELSMMSGRETFPTIQTGTTQIDYKNGTRIDETNLAFDFYTGEVTKTLTVDSYGNRSVNQVTPAYLEYPALGLKTHDDIQSTQHKQMLSQQSSNYTFTVDANNNPIGVVSASVQTWGNDVPVLDPDGNQVNTIGVANSQSNIWRMKANFAWMPAGSSANNLQPYSGFTDLFTTTNAGTVLVSPGATYSANASWKQTGLLTQYNVYSDALEASDINNNYAASRMGYNNGKVLFTGGQARYNELAYAGAEDALVSNGTMFSNQVSPGGGTVVADSTKAHTGVNSLMAPAGAKGFIYTVPMSQLNPAAQNYSVAVWVKPAGGSVSGTSLYYQANGGITVTPTQTYAKTAAGWYLLEMTVPSSAITGSGSLVVGCSNASAGTVYFDDFRFQPTAAGATAYVYDNATGELTYIIGNNNLFTRFQYDAIGRLVRTYKEVLGKSTTPLIKAVNYNYARGN